MKRRTKQLAKKRRSHVKNAVRTAAALVVLMYLLPAVVLLPGARGAAAVQPEQGERAERPEPDLSLVVEEKPEEKYPKAKKEPEKAEKTEKTEKKEEPETKLRCLLEGEERELSLEEYLWGVVAAEMPAAFDQQALCAQAVAARTYTLYRMDHPSGHHPEVDICGDPGCCQAWMSREERLEGWAKGERKTYEKKVTKAIRETEGQYLSYDGGPILAAFHAASAGSTKSALEVWGEDYPYLQEVASPEDEGSVPNYYSTVSVDSETFARSIREAYPKAVLGEKKESWLGGVDYDEAGLPVSIEIGGVRMDTGRVRSLFGLRSASFSAEWEGDNIVFYVTGYGHGVGMSQYGSNALAKEGKSWREILAWYYPGTELAGK